MKTLVLALLAAFALTSPIDAQERADGDILYRMTLLRAAPGRQLELLQDLQQGIRGVSAPRDDRRPLIVRHSQGDHWDFMILAPIGSYRDYFAQSSALGEAAAAELIAWQEDEFVRGPDLRAFPGFFEANLFHVEMFNALATTREALLKERHMENAYARTLGRPVNAIFVRELGASWDVFTIGAWRNWKHYAERDDVDAAKSAAAAKGAGFESDAHIGPYLRSLINTHHDTLATPVR